MEAARPLPELPLAGRVFMLEVPDLKPSKQPSAFQVPTVVLSCSQPVTIKRLQLSRPSKVTSLFNGQETVTFEVETPISITTELALQPGVQLTLCCDDSRVFSKEVTLGFVIGEDGAVWQVHGGNTDVLKRVQYTIV